jgi:hypothetical protein
MDETLLVRQAARGRFCEESIASVMIRLSKHTADEMGRRGIRLAYIAAALVAPARVTLDPKDPLLTRSFKPIPEFGNRVLRVVHRPDGPDVFVVTAHWDRGAKR